MFGTKAWVILKKILLPVVVIGIIFCLFYGGLSYFEIRDEGAKKRIFASETKEIINAITDYMEDNKDFDVQKIDKESIGEILNVSTDNFEKVITTIKEDKVSIVIIGKSDLEGLTVYGNSDDLKIIESDKFNIDKEKPIITLTGDNEITIGVGDAYTDQGATATDNIEGNLTGSIEKVGSVDITKIGEYTLTYTVKDATGNESSKTRIIHVIEETTPPTILIGTNGNSAYVNSKNTMVMVTDNVSVNTSSLKYLWSTTKSTPSEASFGSTFSNGGIINTPSGKTGSYYLWILAKDTSNNTAIIRSNAFNIDNTAPVITLTGNSTVNVNIGSSYNDAGATALDGIDENITNNIETTSTVNKDIMGTYMVTYTVSDSSGNIATPIVRTIEVKDCAGPTVSFGTNGHSQYVNSG
ncbi:MAG: immunoglobulin-like domain-containing protein, partial [Bacilli bacterium]